MITKSDDRVLIENWLDQKYIIKPRFTPKSTKQTWRQSLALFWSTTIQWTTVLRWVWVCFKTLPLSTQNSKLNSTQLKQHCFNSTSNHFYSRLKIQLKQHCFNSTSKSGLKVEQCWRCNSPTLDGRVQCSFRETRQHVQVILSSMANANTNTTTNTKTNANIKIYKYKDKYK